MDFTFRYNSPLGDLTLISDGLSLTGLRFGWQDIHGLCLKEQVEYQNGRAEDRERHIAESNGWVEDRKMCACRSDEQHNESEARYYRQSMLPVFADTCQWLDIYFTGRDPGFLPRLAPAGTPFRKEVWDLLLDIPYGKTTSYGVLAAIVAERRAVNGISKKHVDSRLGGTFHNCEAYRVNGALHTGGAQRVGGIGRMSAQAIGSAVGHNPIPIIIPCHRVIASDGTIGGYSDGIERKVRLLRMEGIML